MERRRPQPAAEALQLELDLFRPGEPEPLPHPAVIATHSENDVVYDASLTRDSQTGRAWLHFAQKPTPDQIAALKVDGWRYGGYRRAWHNPRKGIAPPESLIVSDDGLNDYSAERTDRLDAAAAQAQGLADSHFAGAHQIADFIPVGSPS